MKVGQAVIIWFFFLVSGHVYCMQNVSVDVAASKKKMTMQEADDLFCKPLAEAIKKADVRAVGRIMEQLEHHKDTQVAGRDTFLQNLLAQAKNGHEQILEAQKKLINSVDLKSTIISEGPDSVLFLQSVDCLIKRLEARILQIERDKQLLEETLPLRAQRLEDSIETGKEAITPLAQALQLAHERSTQALGKSPIPREVQEAVKACLPPEPAKQEKPAGWCDLL